MNSDNIAQYNVVESNDLDHWSSLPGNWDTQVTQLSPEPFSSRVRSITLPDVAVYRNQMGGACLFHGSGPKGWVMLGGVVAPERATAHFCGQRIERRDLGLTSGGSRDSLDYSVDSGIYTSMLLISPGLLRKTVGEELTERLCGWHSVNAGEAARGLVELEGRLLAFISDDPGVLSNPVIAAQVRSDLLRAVEECFAHLQPEQEPLSRNRREEVVYQAVQHARQSRKPVSAFELAQSSGVSQKALESSFKQVMGITPGKYLVISRLNEAHHALASGEKGKTTVTEIANAHGFSHVGRFTRNYKRIFGELPSQTLAEGCSLS